MVILICLSLYYWSMVNFDLITLFSLTTLHFSCLHDKGTPFAKFLSLYCPISHDGQIQGMFLFVMSCLIIYYIS